MARGDRNYFRHSVHAGEDHKICHLMDRLGREGYFYFFTLVELCVMMADDTDQTEFSIHPAVLKNRWRTHHNFVPTVLSVMAQCGLIEHSLNGQRSPTEQPLNTQWVTVRIPNLSKFIGKYAVNKIKQNKTKQNKEETPVVPKPKPEKQKQSEASSASPAPEVFHQIVSIWNEKILNLPKAKGCSGARLKRCQVLWKQHGQREYWVDLFLKINETAFLNGKNDRGWTASVDWVLKGDNRIKILEGTYDFSGNQKNRITAANEETLRTVLADLKRQEEEQSK